MRKLPVGPPPKVDTVVDTTLFHEGRAIPLYLNGHRVSGQALGSLDGTPYVVRDRVYRVGGDGSLIAVGTPHDWYGAFPRMSTATGHVFFEYDDRGTAETTLTVMDARTGDVLNVFHGWPVGGQIDPGDRPIIGALMYVDPEAGVVAVSPDGRTGLSVQPDPNWDHPHTEILDQWSLGSKPTVVRYLPFLIPNRNDELSVANPVFESNDAFLVQAYLPNWSGKGPIRMFVARCTLQGACERTTRTATEEVSMAGAGGVLVPGQFPGS